MHLAAINGHPAVVNFFLTHPKAQILKNSNHETTLDIAVKSEQKEVAAVIAKHDRLVPLETIRTDSSEIKSYVYGKGEK